MSATADVHLDDYNPFDPRTQQDPYPWYRAMCRHAPVFRQPGTETYFVTRHDLIIPILRDPTTFSNRFDYPSEPAPPEIADEMGAIQEQGWPRVPILFTEDPPIHTRQRRLVSAALSLRRVEALEPLVRARSVELVDAFLDAGRVEFVSQFAVPLPIWVIAKILNVSTERMDDFKRWSDDCAIAIGAQVPPQRRLEAERSVLELQHYFAAELDERRRRPQDDLLTTLVEAQVGSDEDAKSLDLSELLSIIRQLLVAGNETTTKLLTATVRLLTDHPDEWRRLRDDPSLASTMVEEALRLATPTQGMYRVVTKDVEIAGVPIPAGSRLVLVYAAANRDPAVFSEPDEFRPDRDNHPDHLAFGRGSHFCVGAPLSRLEVRVALETLAERMRSWRIAPGAVLDYEPSFLLRGLKRLDLEFEAEGKGCP
jgi:cytochrome P450